jgi:hypothetical protein
MILLLIVPLIFSCIKNNDINDVLINQVNEIYIKTGELLSELGFSNYSIKMYNHKSIGNVPSSRTVKSIKAIGDGLLPIIESMNEYNPVSWDGYVKTFTNDFNGYYEQKTIVSNYDHNRFGNKTIIYDYISLLIIFDDISDNQKDELLKILNMYIGNSNRGDTIYITSRRLLEE